MKIHDVPAADDDDTGVVESGKKSKKMKKSDKKAEKSSKKEKKTASKPEKKSSGAFSKLPFKQESSIIARAFVQAQKGIEVKALTSFIKKEGGEPNRVLRILRGGKAYGKTWKVHEDKGRIRITY